MALAGPVKGTNPERAAARRLARRRELEALACEEDELSLLEVLALVLQEVTSLGQILLLRVCSASVFQRTWLPKYQLLQAFRTAVVLKNL